MSPRVVVIVQARMSSTRLPGKVLKPLAGAPSILRTMERVARIEGIAEAVVATSMDESDDVLAETCRRGGVRCERGSLTDVLARYATAARQTNADVVVRVTGDCPLIDPAIVARCIRLFTAESAHVAYAANVDERTFPVGLDCEVFSSDALHEAAARARDPYEREHVTPWLRRHVRKISLVQDVDLSMLRWTLDYDDDYGFLATVYDALWPHTPAFDADDVYRLLLERPGLLYVSARTPPDEALRATLLERLRAHLRDRTG